MTPYPFYVNSGENLNLFNRIIRYVAIIVPCMIMISCAGPDKELLPPLEFNNNDLNNQVMLHVAQQENDFSTSDVLTLRMTFKTNTSIVFPNNYNIRLFINQDGSWREIPEKPRIRLPEGDFVYDPLTSHQFPVIFVRPDLKDNNISYNLRIYVSGEMMHENEPKTVAAFIDVGLHP
jgi:hypothetical protein